jgi:hypothetical protein
LFLKNVENFSGRFGQLELCSEGMGIRFLYESRALLMISWKLEDEPEEAVGLE